jgi:hypothetical protein
MKERARIKDRKRDILKKAMNLINRSTKDMKVDSLEKGRLIFRPYKIIGCHSMGVEIEKLMVFQLVKAFHTFFWKSHFYYCAQKSCL